ncbi:leucyl aminopeptidase [Orbus sturtevantii]|uniref:leucyl aminopeptidase n=1 Tax=Orbus sturtevantii TaxID=3074109 RepID=UPI00370D17D8
MNFEIKNNNVLKQKADCLVLPIYQGKIQLDVVQEFEQLSNNLISNLLKKGDFSGKVGETLILFNVPNIATSKVLLVGIGDRKNNVINSVSKISQSVANQLSTLNSKQLSVLMPDLAKTHVYTFVRRFVEEVIYHCYRFDQYQSTKADSIKTEKIVLSITDKTLVTQAELGLTHGSVIAKGVATTRTLANQPSNICNAQYLANSAKQLSKQFSSIKASYYDEKALAKLGMNTYLAVGQGSQNESIMTVMEYHGAKDKTSQPIVLVGKGLTFDSGGISIKPSAGMDEMKYDMCGAATVYGVMQIVAELNLPLNVIGVMAGCENMPGTGAYRPGDILTTLSGQTVEVINTDAEGRLVLCDVLTFVERFKPAAVIDIATLTGACIVALGHHYTGIMGNNDKLIEQLVAASNQADDKAWPLPLDDDFQQQIKSTCADLVNSAGRDGGTITAGCFLSRFTKNYHWAHLDIAGTAWVSGAKKGATGRPVAMLVEYLLQQAH